MMKPLCISAAALGLLAACGAPTGGIDPSRDTSAMFSPPEESGLIAVRAFPGPRDVCQVVGENDTSREFLDDSATLIACPAQELGAIEDRVNEGAVLVARANQWWLLSVPDS
ncbi:MAG: hypothetical protein AAFV31_07575 [Pseudomonadota bacterium]